MPGIIVQFPNLRKPKKPTRRRNRTLKHPKAIRRLFARGLRPGDKLEIKLNEFTPDLVEVLVDIKNRRFAKLGPRCVDTITALYVAGGHWEDLDVTPHIDLEAGDAVEDDSSRDKFARLARRVETVTITIGKHKKQ